MNVHISGLSSAALDRDKMAALAALVLRDEGCPADTEVAVSLVDEAEMAEWNLRALGREGPTDVLAFPLENLQPGSPPPPSNGGPPALLGDVLIAPVYVQRQAEELGSTAEDEMALMVVHGILHLLGYDHTEEAEAERMEQRERSLLAMTGRVRR
jgi:probable rRNA maturation factor